MVSRFSSSKTGAATGFASTTSDFPAMVDHAAQLLVNRSDAALRLRSLDAARPSRWYSSRRNLSRGELAAALQGKHALGLYAVGQDGFSRWVVLDADTDEAFDTLKRFAASLSDHKGLLLETSRRGGHLWCFHQPVPWHRSAFQGDRLASAIGLAGIEVYPKNAGLNGVRCPGSLHRLNSVSYPAIDLATGELIDPLVALAAISPITLPDPGIDTAPRPAVQVTPHDPGSFTDLVRLFQSHTQMKTYGHERAIGKCLWHDDHTPSLGVAGNRFRCFACKSWGSIVDLRRWLDRGVLPPRG